MMALVLGLFILFVWGMFVLARDHNGLGIALMWVPCVIANGLALDGMTDVPNALFQSGPAGAGARIWALFILPPTLVLLAVSLVGWGIGNKVEVRK